MSNQTDEEPAFDSPDGFALRIKHQKHVLCVPVDPQTTYDGLAETCLSILARSSIDAAPEHTGVSSFDELIPGDVVLYKGHYVAATEGSNNFAEELKFVEIDRKQRTVGAMGLKDGADAVVYIGFKDKSTGKARKPDVSIPPTFDEDDEDTETQGMATEELNK